MVYINDPAMGRRQLTSAELDECLHGHRADLSPRGGPPAEKHQDHRPLPAGAPPGPVPGARGPGRPGLLLVVPGVLVPLFSQLFIDQILLEGNCGWLAGFCTLLGEVALQGVLTVYRGWMLARLQNKMSLLSCHALPDASSGCPSNFSTSATPVTWPSGWATTTGWGNFSAGDLAETAFHLFSALFYLILLLLYSPLLTVIAAATVAMNLLGAMSTSEVLYSASVCSRTRARCSA